MGLIIDIYKKNFLQRFDKDAAIPYYSAADFPGLSGDEGSFTNAAGVQIRYFTYWYDRSDPDRLILFCPGMGPGHTAYLAEIETFCRAGFRVLTLDYTGCGASGGERLPSVNTPVKDVLELLDLVRGREEIIPVGHSLGGYTALTVTHLSPGIRRAVIISGFVGISDEMMGFVRLRLLADRVKKYEKKLDPRFGDVDNLSYLKETPDRILWIHSTDDPMVNYRYNAGRVLKTGGPGVRVITVHGKGHHPQYTEEAMKTMNAWIGEYGRLVRKKVLVSEEARKAYFADKPIGRMTAQDPAVYEEIFRFIGK